MDRFLSLQAFVSVAETGSFADTARRLGVSRSVVSERVRQMEELLGDRLLHRTTRSVTLSELGERLFPDYRDLVSKIDDIENTAPAHRQSLSGRLRICSVTDIGVFKIAPAASTFSKLHPGIAIELVTENKVINPIEAGFDIAFHVRQGPASDVDEIIIAEVPSTYCAAPGYLETAGAIGRPADLRSHVCVNYSLQPNRNEWTFRRGAETATVRVPFMLSSNSGQVLRAWALAKHGITVLPFYRVAQDIQLGELVRILPDWEAPPLHLTATVPRSHRHTQKVQLFLEHVRDHDRRS